MTRFDHWRSCTDAALRFFRLVERRSSGVAALLAVPLLIGSVCATAQTLTTLYNFGAERGDGTFPWAITGDGQGNLYGVASLDGTRDGDGALFRLSPPAEPGELWTHTVLYRFRGTPDGSTPECIPVLTAGGKVFCTTYLGGLHGMGTAFVAGPGDTPDAPWREKPIYSFGAFAGDGINPNSGLLYVRGKLYGTTSGGGATRRGTVFVLSPPLAPGDDWTETILHNFQPGGDASFPLGELAADRHGNLYGTTLLGGVNDVGTVFRMVPPARPDQPIWTESVLHSFDGTDGSSPEGRLLVADDGALYGTTGGGGPEEGGTVFKLTPPADPTGSWTHSVIYPFTGGRDGGSPAGGVSMDAQGRLWGAASTGGNGGPDFGGVLFVLQPPANPDDPWTETVLTSFGGPNGFRPTSPLVSRNGAIYGVTTAGGAFGDGTAFEFKFGNLDAEAPR